MSQCSIVHYQLSLLSISSTRQFSNSNQIIKITTRYNPYGSDYHDPVYILYTLRYITRTCITTCTNTFTSSAHIHTIRTCTAHIRNMRLRSWNSRRSTIYKTKHSPLSSTEHENNFFAILFTNLPPVFKLFDWIQSEIYDFFFFLILRLFFLQIFQFTTFRNMP